MLVNEEYPFEVEWQQMLQDIVVHELYRMASTFVFLCSHGRVKRCLLCIVDLDIQLMDSLKFDFFLR